MGIAAYNRGSRAISDYIDQQLNESKVVKQPKPMWRSPRGWFKAAIYARLERENTTARIEDNEHRRKYGLPTYEI